MKICGSACWLKIKKFKFKKIKNPFRLGAKRVFEPRGERNQNSRRGFFLNRLGGFRVDDLVQRLLQFRVLFGSQRLEKFPDRRLVDLA